MLHLLLLLLVGLVTAAVPPQWLDLTSRSIKWTLSNATLNVAGTVPGAVHTDLLAAGVVPEPYDRFGDTDLRWVALSDAWQYSATFSVTSDVLSAVRCCCCHLQSYAVHLRPSWPCSRPTACVERTLLDFCDPFP